MIDNSIYEFLIESVFSFCIFFRLFIVGKAAQSSDYPSVVKV